MTRIYNAKLEAVFAPLPPEKQLPDSQMPTLHEQTLGKLPISRHPRKEGPPPPPTPPLKPGNKPPLHLPPKHTPQLTPQHSLSSRLIPSTYKRLGHIRTIEITATTTPNAREIPQSIYTIYTTAIRLIDNRTLLPVPIIGHVRNRRYGS